jgi:hypothetical protein
MSARVYGGGAAATTLSSGITSGATSIPVADASTWPSSGAFSVVIDKGLSGEEKVLIASRSGNTLTATTRGYDGTSAAAHLSAATIQCCGTAIDFQEANDHINATTGHGATGAVMGTTNSQTVTNKTIALGSNTVSGTTAQFNTANTDGDFATLAGAENLTNKTITSPTIGGPTISSATITGSSLDGPSTHGGVSGTVLATMPRGRVASSQNFTDTTALSTTAAMVGTETGSFTLTAGRRYRFSVSVPVFESTNSHNSLASRLHDGGGSSPTTGSATLTEGAFLVDGASARAETLTYWIELLCVASGATNGQINAGTHNVRPDAFSDVAISSSISASSTKPVAVLVEDIGV